MVTKKERPIIFSTDMVKAILEGRKTQTRRVLNPQPEELIDLTGIDDYEIGNVLEDKSSGDFEIRLPNYEWLADIRNPYGQPGDLLWVRETWAMYLDGFIAKSTNTFFKGVKWKPSIHMKKVYAQIWLEITDIRVERLQDISYQDAKAEGIEPIGENCEGATLFRNYENPPDYIAEGELSSRLSFRSLWDSINSKPGNRKPVTWNANPWVWVVSFKVLSTSGKPNQFQQLEKEYRNGC